MEEDDFLIIEYINIKINVVNTINCIKKLKITVFKYIHNFSFLVKSSIRCIAYDIINILYFIFKEYSRILSKNLYYFFIIFIFINYFEKYKSWIIIWYNGGFMGNNNDEINIRNFELVLNNNIILAIFVVFGISIILSGFLSYILSYSLLTIIFGIIIGVTIGIMSNYFIIRSKKLIKEINFEISRFEEDEDKKIHTTMKF